jgi:putative thioredoxin
LATYSGVSEDPLEATFYNALRLAKRGNIEAALDGLLDVLRQDKRYRNDEVRIVFLGLLELLGEQDPIVRSYRSELASILF